MRPSGANDATRDTNKLYAGQKSFDYHSYQYARLNPTISNSFELRKKCLTEMWHATVIWKVVATIRLAKQEPNEIPFCSQ